MSEINQEIKIAVLEERIDVYERMMRRIDSAIEKISENSQNISQMLTIHNEKIEQCNKLDDVILKMVEEIKINSKEQHDEIRIQLGKRIDTIEVKVDDLIKFRWIAAGVVALGLVLIPIVSSFVPLSENSNLEQLKNK